MRAKALLAIAVIVLIFAVAYLNWRYVREHPLYLGNIRIEGNWLVYETHVDAHFVIVSNETHKVIGPTRHLRIPLNRSSLKLEVWWSGAVRYEYLIYYDAASGKYDFYWWYNK